MTYQKRESIKQANDMTHPNAVPAELIGKFETLAEAAKALCDWNKEHRGPCRPKTRNLRGVNVQDLGKMLKPKTSK